uniref:SGNH hydrolase subfamily protein n=1 Tax=uncultured bacterium CSLC2 TaxID=1091571 RepID=Q8KP08_9BACT|nr:SGNH hydrolase subfamily protein [uncultured bacterium CSLC2]
MNTARVLSIVVGVVVVLIIIEGVRLLRHIAISKRITKDITKFERQRPAARTRLLFVGDSTGYGTGTSHARFSLVGRLGADYPDAHIENVSRNGSLLIGVRDTLRDIAETSTTAPYDTVILMAGGMDMLYGTPRWLVRRLLQSALTYGKRCGRAVVLVGPNNAGRAPLYRFPLSNLYQGRARQFDALYREAAQQANVHFVSLYGERTDPLVERNLFATDKTHPNDEGYGIWYDQMKGVISSTLPS